MRDLSSMIEAALESEEGKMFWFLELGFDTPLRYTDCDVDLWIPDADEYIDNPDSLVGLWRFNEGSGSVAVDGSGNGLDGTLVNMEDADWVDGISGKCLSFDGGIGSLESVNCGGGLEPTSAFTYSAWVYALQDRLQFIMGVSGTGADGTWMAINSPGKIHTSICDNGQEVSASNVFTINAWHHVVLTWDESTRKAYVDGVEVISTADSTAITYSTAYDTTIGNTSGSGEAARMWDGLIDEVRIYSTALTASEIKALYDNPGQFTINKYETMPFSISAVNYSAKSSVDKVEIEIGNVDLQMSAVFLSEDIMNKWGTLKVGFFDSDNQIIDQTFKVFEGLVSTWKLTEPKASITFVNEFVLWNKKTLRKYQSACRWPFKSTECGYTGAETWCDQGYARCTALDNTDNFSGFRWLPDLMEKQIYWGKTT